MLVTLDTSHFERSPLNENAELNIPYISVTLDTSHFEMSPLKEFAPANMAYILVTLDTSHFEMSPLNDVAELNVRLISVTVETSQDPMGPWGPLEQSVGARFRHSFIAALNSSLDLGAHAMVLVMGYCTWSVIVLSLYVYSS